jgi:uncharacterized membrane protein YidH (DUF202 family)
MDILVGVLLVGVVVAAFFKYREHFYALESATDSNRGHAFWTILAVIFAILITVAYFLFF